MAKQNLTFYVNTDIRQGVQQMAYFKSVSTETAKGIAKAFALKLSSDSVVNFTKHVIDAAGSVKDLSLKTGLTIASVQRFDYAAKQSGTSVETIGVAFKRMQKEIGATEPSEKFKAALDRIGISFENIKKMTPEAQFETIMRSLSDIKDPAERANLALTMFKGAGQDLLPMLEGGSAAFDDLIKKADELGIVFTDKAVEAADKFKDSLATLEQASMAMVANSGLIEWLQGVVGSINDVMDARNKVDKLGASGKGTKVSVVDEFLNNVASGKAFGEGFTMKNALGKVFGEGSMAQKVIGKASESIPLESLLPPGVLAPGIKMAGLGLKAMGYGEGKEGSSQIITSADNRSSEEVTKANEEKKAKDKAEADRKAAIEQKTRETKAKTSADLMEGKDTALKELGGRGYNLGSIVDAKNLKELNEAAKKIREKVKAEEEILKIEYKSAEEKNKIIARIAELKQDQQFATMEATEKKKQEYFKSKISDLKETLNKAKRELSKFGVDDITQSVIKTPEQVKQEKSDAKLAEKLDAINQGKQRYLSPAEKRRVAELEQERQAALKEEKQIEDYQKKMEGSKGTVDNEAEIKNKARSRMELTDLQKKLGVTKEAAQQIVNIKEANKDVVEALRLVKDVLVQRLPEAV